MPIEEPGREPGVGQTLTFRASCLYYSYRCKKLVEIRDAWVDPDRFRSATGTGTSRHGILEGLYSDLMQCESRTCSMQAALLVV